MFIPELAYQHLLRPLLFRMDAENAHRLTFRLASMPGFAALAGLGKPPVNLTRKVFGLQFQSPVGLAAGMDKNAELLETWQKLGLGFVEIGTVTPRPQAGNPRPRLFRLPADEALMNRMGFNNEGMLAIARRLEKRPSGLIVGANIGRNKDTPNELAAEDYLACLRHLHALADYFVVNVSSPNTPGLRSLQDREPLTRLLAALQHFNQGQRAAKPLLLKIAPDLEDSQLDDVIAVAADTQLAGIVATNTTLSRAGLLTPAETVAALEPGGLSGRPLAARSRDVVRYLRSSAPELPIIGVGGIFSGADARSMLSAGASLVQVYSGLVYRGPRLLRDIYSVLAA